MFRRIEDIILTNQVNLKEMRAPEKCKLRSLRCSKLRAASFGACVAASSEQQASELGAWLLQARSSELACCELGACCSKLWTYPELSGARSLLHERNASFGEAPKLRSLLQQAPSSKLHGTKKKKKAMPSPSPSSSSSFLATQRRSNSKRNAYLGLAWVQLQSLQAPISFQIPSSLPLQAGSKLQACSRSTSLEPGALAVE